MSRVNGIVVVLMGILLSIIPFGVNIFTIAGVTLCVWLCIFYMLEITAASSHQLKKLADKANQFSERLKAKRIEIYNHNGVIYHQGTVSVFLPDDSHFVVYPGGTVHFHKRILTVRATKSEYERAMKKLKKEISSMGTRSQ